MLWQSFYTNQSITTGKTQAIKSTAEASAEPGYAGKNECNNIGVTFCRHFVAVLTRLLFLVLIHLIVPRLSCLAGIVVFADLVLLSQSSQFRRQIVLNFD